MFCPKCEAEYRAGVTRCPDCDEGLVGKLDSSKAPAGQAGPALAWRGNDPVAFSRALAALRENNIQTHQIDDHDQLSHIGAYRPSYGIFVRREDVSRAEKVIRETFAGLVPD
jgi:Putative prokaryotic signal transducing protein